MLKSLSKDCFSSCLRQKVKKMRDGSRDAEKREEETKQENNSSFKILLQPEDEPRKCFFFWFNFEKLLGNTFISYSQHYLFWHMMLWPKQVTQKYI